MHRRSLTLVTVILLFLMACALTSPENTQPALTLIPSATAVSDSALATETPEAEPSLVVDRLSQLDVIDAGNWSGLQLLKSFPAEMPLQLSAVAISPDGKIMAVGSSNGAQIHFFDLASGQLSQTVAYNGVANVDAYFHAIEYLPDATLMANSDGPYMIYHLDPQGNVLSAWESSSFALSADKTIVAFGAGEGTTLVEIAGNEPLTTFEGDYALDYSFSPDGTRIATNVVGVDYVNTVLWDIPTQTQLATLIETGNPRFSPDGRFLAVTSYAESTTPLQIFSSDGANELTTLTVKEVNGLDGRAPLWSWDGSMIAAQIASGPVIAWDTTNWQRLDAPAVEGEIHSFSPDGRILITRTLDGGILLWGVVP